MKNKKLAVITLFYLVLFWAPQSFGATIQSKGTGITGNWTDTSTWINNVIPTSSDIVEISGGDNITINTNATCNRLDIKSSSGGTALTVSGSQSLSITDRFYLFSGVVNGSVSITMNGPITCDKLYGLPGFDGNTFNLSGTSTLSATSFIDLRGYLGGQGTFTMSMASSNTSLLILQNNGSTSSCVLNLNTAMTVNTLWLASATSVNDLSLDTRFANCSLTVNSQVKTTNVGGSIFSDNSNGVFTMNGTSGFTSNSDMTFPTTILNSNISLTGEFICAGSLTINSNKTLTSNSNNISVAGNFTNNGTLTLTDGDNFTFNGSSAQIINSSATTKFSDLILDNTSGVTLSSGQVEISGSLEILNGTFTTNDKVKLLDEGSGIAPIKQIQGTGAISGALDMEFKIASAASPLTKVDYRHLSMPISGQTVGTFDNCSTCFYSYGFTGSDGGASTTYSSTYMYDNTGTMSSASDGWKIPASDAVTMDHLQGAAWYGGPDGGSNSRNYYDFTLSGNINSGTVSINSTNAKMKFTGTADYDWALIGNPFASQINNTNMTFTNCGGGSKEMWVYEAEAGGYNADKSNVPPFQAFWVEITGSNAEVSIPQSAKTGSKTNFLKSLNPEDQIMVKLIQGNSTSLINYNYIEFNTKATNDFDLGMDVKEKRNVWPFPDVALMSGDDKEVCRYITNPNQGHIVVPIRTWTYTSGQHTLQFNNIDEIDGCIVLEDTYEDSSKMITSIDNEYRFTLSDTTRGVRFKLHIYNMAEELIAENSTCFASNDGRAELKLYDHGKNGTKTIDWFDNNENLIFMDFLSKNKSEVKNLAPGKYTAVIRDFLNCPASTEYFTILEPAEMTPKYDFANEIISFKTDQEISFDNTSSGAILSYHWDFGDNNTSTLKAPSHVYSKPGTFEIALTTKNGNDDCDVSYSRKIDVIDSYLSIDDDKKSLRGYKYFVRNNDLIIDFENPLKFNTEFEILSINGQVLQSGKINQGSTQAIISIEDTPNTILLSFEANSGISAIKLVK